MEHNGHELETDRFLTRRVRDVRVLRCIRCGLMARVGMRSVGPLEAKVASLGLPPCPGVRPVVEPSEVPSEARSGVPMVIPSGGIFFVGFRYGEDE
jgi:hypothetical protein